MADLSRLSSPLIDVCPACDDADSAIASSVRGVWGELPVEVVVDVDTQDHGDFRYGRRLALAATQS